MLYPGFANALQGRCRPRFFHSYGVIELDAAISLLLAKVRCSPPVRQLSEIFLNRVFSICIRHELFGPISSGPFYDYQCTMSRTERDCPIQLTHLAQDRRLLAWGALP